MTLNHETLGKKNFQNNGLILKENLDWFVLVYAADVAICKSNQDQARRLAEL